MKLIECFKIRLLSFISYNDIFDIKKGDVVHEIKCLKPIIDINPTIIVADPFLFVHKGILFLFYERKKLSSPGEIMMTCTKDLESWSKPIVVLKENFHLSYPFVFQDNGRIYMVPESGEDGSIRLYESINDQLSEFRFIKKIIEQNEMEEIIMGYGDSSIYKKDGVYYLMTMLQYDKPINTLELFISDNLFGPYKKHVCSPVEISQKIGRNAGSWIEYDGKLLRVSQDCTNRYGDNVNVSEITNLSPSSYEERIILENILPKRLSFYKEGGHQFNMVKFKGKWIVATDAKEYHSLICHRFIRSMLK